MRYALFAGKLLIAGGLLAWLWDSGRLDVTALVAVPAPGLHVLGISLVLASFLLQGVRWWLLLAVQGIALPLAKVLRFAWIGYFYSLVLPGVGGGDLVRGAYVVRAAAGARLKASTTVLMDRVLGLYSVLCFGVLAAVARGPATAGGAAGMATLLLTVVGLFAACTAVAGALLLRPARVWLRRVLPRRLGTTIADAADGYAGNPQALRRCLGLSLAASGLLLVAFVVAGLAVGIEVSLPQAVLAVPLVYIVNTLPLAPGGVGVGEAAAAVVFAATGVSGGATLMLTVRLWQAVTRLPGLLLVLGGGGPLKASRLRGESGPGEREGGQPAAGALDGERA